MKKTVLGVWFVCVGCGPAAVEPLPSEPCAATTSAPAYASSLAAPPEDDALGIEVAAASDLAFVSEPAFGADQAIALTIRGGTTVHSGNRAEITVHDSDPLCQESWTRWHMMLPEDFVDPDPDALRWHIVAQWHDQPDTSRGESWETYPGNSPMIIVSYGIYDPRYAQALEEAGIPNVFSPGQPLLTLSYGVGEGSRTVGAVPVEKGTWWTLEAHTLMSLGEDGFAGVWVDGRPLANSREAEGGYVRGRNMFNRAPAYLKLGLYRNPELTDTNTLYLDELERGADRL